MGVYDEIIADFREELRRQKEQELRDATSVPEVSEESEPGIESAPPGGAR